MGHTGWEASPGGIFPDKASDVKTIYLSFNKSKRFPISFSHPHLDIQTRVWARTFLRSPQAATALPVTSSVLVFGAGHLSKGVSLTQAEQDSEVAGRKEPGTGATKVTEVLL